MEKWRRYIGAGVTALVIGLIALTMLSVAYSKDSNWWAAWGQWVGGIGSIVAAGIAVWIAVEGWRRSEEQSREQARRFQDAQDREQAAHFGVWTQVDGSDLDVLYRNAGLLPVHEVVVTPVVGFTGAESGRFRLGNVGPTEGTEKHLGLSKAIRDLVANELSRSFAETLPGADGEPRPTNAEVAAIFSKRLKLISSAAVRVTFRDANGVTWTREPTGQLTRADHP